MDISTVISAQQLDKSSSIKLLQIYVLYVLTGY